MTLTDKARAGFSSITIRGGRMTKCKGQSASYAPHVGEPGLGVSTRALAIGLAFAGAMVLSPQARAGTCTESPVGSGTWLCSGAAGADATQTIAIPATKTGTITTAPGFGVTTAAGNAITVTTDAASTGLSLTDANASTITGKDNGVYVKHSGTGATSVTLTGTVTGTMGYGVNVSNNSSASSLSVSTNNASGAKSGLYINNYGTGALRVASTGTATGTTYDGIYAWNSAYGTDLTVDAVDSTGYYNGIRANNQGTGALRVTSTGTASGSYSDGINAFNSGAGTDLTVDAVDSSGGYFGVRARNYGSGALSVTSTGTATGTSKDGIYAFNSGAGTDLTVDAVDSIGGESGIDAVNYGSGALSVTSTGTASGSYSDGINAYNSSASTSLMIKAKDANGDVNGINANNQGSGALSVTSSGTATGGTFGSGIYALNALGTSLTVDATAAAGGIDGIYARNHGTEGLKVYARGDVTGATRDGIRTYNSSTDQSHSTYIFQAAGTTTSGAVNGIYANNNAGSLTIKALGTSNGGTGDGIHAVNYSGVAPNPGTDLTITSAVAEGGENGIWAQNYGSGAVSVTSTGTATGTARYGIYARSASTGTDLTVNANNATGGVSGIETYSFGAGGATVNLTGTAKGGSGAAIDTYTDPGIPASSSAAALTTINLMAGSQALAGSSGVAIRNNVGDSVLNVYAGASIVGQVFLDNGSDTANLNGANVLGGITLLDGGSGSAGVNGIDTLKLNGVIGSSSGSIIKNWEVIDINDGSKLTLSGITTQTVNVAGNSVSTLTSLTATTLNSTGSATTLNGSSTVATFNTCGGSATVGGTATVGSIEGCVSVDTIMVQENSKVTGKIEGAGGADTISVLGNASVLGGVYGGGAGQDGSAAADGNDVIMIDTTGTVSLVDGGAGDDMLSLKAGTITGNASGGDGKDTISLSGAIVSGAIDGGSGDDGITLASGSAGSVLGGDGDDAVNWTSAAASTPLVSMGNGSDTLNINDPALALSSVTLDGGSGIAGVNGTDTLNLNNSWTGSLKGAQTTNWEVINLGGGKLGFSDAAISAGTINVNSGGTLDGSNSLQASANVNVGAGSYLVAGNAGGTNAMKITGNLTNAGTVQLSGPAGQHAAGDVLSVTGTYTGTGGAALAFDTVLGSSHASDALKIGGNLTGSGLVSISNVGGTGALTSGDGIKLVDVAGTSSGTLTLNSANQRIDVGAFRYQLFGGGLANPGDQDWYLRSRARDIVLPSQAIARVSQDLGLDTLGTLNERIGEQVQNGGEGRAFAGMWGRLLGSDYSARLTSSAFGDSRSDGKWGGMQLGLDLWQSGGSGARTVVGAYGGYLWSSTSDGPRSGAFPLGKTRSDGAFTGLYATYYGASGWYADAVVQGNWLGHDASGNDGTTLHTKSSTWLASIELGKPFALGGSFKLEPQVQLIYGDTQIDGTSDSAGFANSWSVENSLTGRAGLRLKRTWDLQEGKQFTFYLKSNVWRTLDGGSTVLTVGVSAPGAFQARKSWVDGGLGATFSLSRSAELFFDVDATAGLDKPGTALSGHSGLRIRF